MSVRTVTAIAALLLCAVPLRAQRDLARTVERDVLRELFLIRERAGRLVLYEGPVESAPAFSQTPLPDGMHPSRLSARDVGAEAMSARALAAHFRAHPDGWRAWYARFPGAGGLIERTAPLIMADSAIMIVARTCGEHCQQAWIVTARRDDGARWAVVRREPFPLPRP